MRRGWRRTAVVVTALAGLVLTTAGSCDKGNVIEVKRYEDARGNTICDITVRPDDMDSAPFKLKKQHVNRCNRCPVGSRWPDCNKKE